MNQGMDLNRGLNSSTAVAPWADSQGCFRGDFVHYVMHMAAYASGERCELCTSTRPVTAHKS